MAFPDSNFDKWKQEGLLQYIQDFRKIYKSGRSVVGGTEAQLQRLVAQLFEPLDVELRAEVRSDFGRPDLGVLVSGILVGFIELKAPGKDISPKNFKGHDAEQWEGFKNLPNLI